MWLWMLLACGTPVEDASGDTGAVVEECELVATLAGPDGELTDEDAGYRGCDPTTVDHRGNVHRVEAVDCLLDTTTKLECDECSDCEAGQFCGFRDGDCACIDPCTTDSDCGTDEVCVCASGFPLGGDRTQGLSGYSECMPANCTTDADCGEGTCSMSHNTCLVPEGLYCHTGADECTTDADCSGNLCRYSAAAGHWTCTNTDDCE